MPRILKSLDRDFGMASGRPAGAARRLNDSTTARGHLPLSPSTFAPILPPAQSIAMRGLLLSMTKCGLLQAGQCFRSSAFLISWNGPLQAGQA